MSHAPAPADTATPGTLPAIASRLPNIGTATLRNLLGQRLVGADTAGAPAAGIPTAAFTSSI